MEAEMFNKCDTNCDAKVPHLWLRNNIFYYKVKIIYKKGEFYCKTIEEAEKSGFRRAMRHHFLEN
jgi:hypothetical protein